MEKLNGCVIKDEAMQGLSSLFQLTAAPSPVWKANGVAMVKVLRRGDEQTKASSWKRKLRNGDHIDDAIDIYIEEQSNQPRLDQRYGATVGRLKRSCGIKPKKLFAGNIFSPCHINGRIEGSNEKFNSLATNQNMEDNAMIGCLQRDNGQTEAASGSKGFIVAMTSSATGTLVIWSTQRLK